MLRISRWIPLLVAALLSAPVSAVTEITETLASGAHIRIAVPAGWTPGDGLLLYQHGFNMEFDSDPDLGPIRDRQLADGYAVAASGYRGRGWALFNSVADNRDLLARFVERFGPPGHLLSMGGSMGGLIAHQLAEAEGFESLRGVYSLCPPAAGTRTWDTAFDLRMAYDAICDGVGGGELLRGEEPLPWAYDLNDIPTDLGDLFGTESLQQSLVRINQCTGIALSPLLRTPPQRDRLQQLMDFGAFSDEDFLLTNLAYATYALGDLVRAPDKLAARNPFTSFGVDYDSGLIQSRVPDIRSDAIARLDFRLATDLSGRAAPKVRMLSLHTSADELVRPAHQQTLRALYPATQLLSALVNEDAPSHCGFTLAEVTAGWELIRAAAQSTAPMPGVAEVQTRCLQLQGSGVAGPCRIDVGLVPGDINETMRARGNQNPTTEVAALNLTGAWYDPQRSGEGLLIETLNEESALVIWFTYPPSGQGAQAWLLGVGRIQGHGIVVDDLRSVSGARFGAAFDPDDVVRAHWGRLKLAAQVRPDLPAPVLYPGLGQLQLSVEYDGPAGWTGSRLLHQQLLEVGRNPALPPSAGSDPRRWQNSGTFYDPARSGEGFQLQQFDAGNGSWPTVITWFTFDTQGQPMWLIGLGTANGSALELDLLRPSGTHFGLDFVAANVVRAPWGSARIEFDGCDRVRLHWQAIDPAYGSGTLAAQRLTTPSPVQPCAAPGTPAPLPAPGAP
jgi:hypothetical protein